MLVLLVVVDGSLWLGNITFVSLNKSRVARSTPGPTLMRMAPVVVTRKCAAAVSPGLVNISPSVMTSTTLGRLGFLRPRRKLTAAERVATKEVFRGPDGRASSEARTWLMFVPRLIVVGVPFS